MVDMMNSYMRMPDISTFCIAWAATAAVFLFLDFLWLSTMTSALYRPRIGAHLAVEPRLVVAAVFYVLYAAGAAWFAVTPGLANGSWPLTLVNGALLGGLAYGTYNATNLATLRDWSALVAVVDTSWGIVLTATASCAGLFVARFVHGLH